MDGSGVTGRGVPDIVRMTPRKRRCGCGDVDGDRSSSKRSGVGAASSAWNCAGVAWNGLRRTLSVLRRSSRGRSRRRRDRQPRPTNIGSPLSYNSMQQLF